MTQPIPLQVAQQWLDKWNARPEGADVSDLIEIHPAGQPDTLAEAIAAAIWERCATDLAHSLTCDDPRNIAAVAATVARQVLGTTTEQPVAEARDCPACDAGIEHTEHCPTPETHNAGCGCPSDVAAAYASCPGYEMSPSPCRCPCYGCKHHCSAHQPNPRHDRAAGAETPLRDRIRRAVCEAEGFGWDTDMLEPDEYGEVADAVLAVLPAPVDRAAILRERADFFEGCLHNAADPESDPRYWTAIRDVAMGLRRLADEAQQPTPTVTEETTPTARCNTAVISDLGATGRQHAAHDWEPQPGMTPVRCPGTP